MSEPEVEPRRPRRGLTSIRSKLLLALAVPVLVVAGITAVQATQAQRSLKSTQDEVDLALAAGGPSTYATALLDERNLTALDTLGIVGAVDLARFEGVPDDEKVTRAHQLTDVALDEFRASVETSTAQVRELYQPILQETTAQLGQARQDANDFPAEKKDVNNREAGDAALGVYDDYSAILAELFGANEAAISELGDAELHNRADSIAAQTRSGDLVSLMLRAAALPVLDVGVVDRPEMQTLLTQYSASEQLARDGVANDPEASEVVNAYYDRPNKVGS